jgi:hypothetical protein
MDRLNRRAPLFSLSSSNEERAGVRSRSSFRFSGPTRERVRRILSPLRGEGMGI